MIPARFASIDQFQEMPIPTTPRAVATAAAGSQPSHKGTFQCAGSRQRVGCGSPPARRWVAGRAWVACDGDNQLVVLALPGLTELGHLDVGDGPDVLAADPARGLLYVAAESGDVTTVDTRPAAGRVTGRAHLADNAHVVAVDPATGRAYFPVPDTGAGRPGLLVTAPKETPQ